MAYREQTSRLFREHVHDEGDFRYFFYCREGVVWTIEGPDSLSAMIEWCEAQFGKGAVSLHSAREKEARWVFFTIGVFIFRTLEDGFAFKMRWG